jgi:hypothetical protein
MEIICLLIKISFPPSASHICKVGVVLNFTTSILKKMTTTLHISPSKHVYELQQEFSKTYPFLRLDFYLSRLTEPGRPVLTKKLITTSTLLKDAGLKKDGDLDISGTMTVAELEKLITERYGMNVQVVRRSGNIWLETTMTDDWTLQQQNDHGREITTHGTLPEDAPDDFDLERDNP